MLKVKSIFASIFAVGMVYGSGFAMENDFLDKDGFLRKDFEVVVGNMMKKQESDTFKSFEAFYNAKIKTILSKRKSEIEKLKKESAEKKKIIVSLVKAVIAEDKFFKKRISDSASDVDILTILFEAYVNSQKVIANMKKS